MTTGRYGGAAEQRAGAGMEARARSPRSCANCGGALSNIGPRAKWCDRCAQLARAMGWMRSAIGVLQRTGWPETASRLQYVVNEITPRGNVSRADYLAGKSKR